MSKPSRPPQTRISAAAQSLTRRLRAHYGLYTVVVVLGDFLLSQLIIRRVAYTEIDWRAYMQQVEGYQQGERNYMKLRGDAGPIVYPAGFVYVFSWLYDLTDYGTDIRRAQHIFSALYALTLLIVLQLYRRSNMHPLAVPFLCLSKRLHSIYVLRLFNDGFVMLFVFLAIYLMTLRRKVLATTALSLAVSIKMNALLMLPAHLFLLATSSTLPTFVLHVVYFVGLQVGLGAPFLATFPREYLSRAFELGRVFLFKWTVNWKMVPEEVFVSAEWGNALLVLWLASVFALLARYLRLKVGHTLPSALRGFLRGQVLKRLQTWSTDDIVMVYFATNLLGIVFARSLHYQFYAWYCFTIPFLLAHMRVPWLIRLACWLAIESCWNVFPATATSSSILLLCHAFMITGLV